MVRSIFVIAAYPLIAVSVLALCCAASAAAAETPPTCLFTGPSVEVLNEPPY